MNRTTTTTRQRSFLRSASLMLAFAGSVAACDSGSNEPSLTDPAQSGETGEAADVAARGEAHAGDRRGGHKSPGDRLCKMLECSDAQATQIAELFARPERDPAQREAKKAERDAANTKLAAAFRSEQFAGADLARHRSQRPQHEPKTDEKLEKLAALHAILTPEQRAKLADRFEKGGMPLLGGGKGGHGPKRGGHGPGGMSERHGSPEGGSEGRDEPDAAERIAHRAEKICDGLSCTAAQVQQLQGLLESAHSSRPDESEIEARKAERQKMGSELATAFRAESFDESVFASAMAKRKEAGEERRELAESRQTELMVGIHGVLTPAQRATVATRIEKAGPRGIMGAKEERHKGGKGGKGGKRGGRKGRHGGKSQRG